MATNVSESTQGETAKVTSTKTIFEQWKYSYLAKQLANADSETWYGKRNIKFKQIWTSLITTVGWQQCSSVRKLNSIQKARLPTSNRHILINMVLQTIKSTLNNFDSFV